MAKRLSTKIIVLSVLVVTLIVFSSCQTSNTHSSGKLSFDFNYSKAVEIGYNISQVHVKLTHETGIIKEADLTIDSTNERASGTITNLRIGKWTVFVNLYENDTIIGSGTTIITIEPNKTTDAYMKINLSTGNAKIVVEWGISSSNDNIVDEYYKNSKLVAKIETGADFDFDTILSDSILNAIQTDDGIYWDHLLKYTTDSYTSLKGRPEIKVRVFVTKSGDIYAGPITGTDEEQLKLLTFGGISNFSKFEGGYLDKSIYGIPKDAWLEANIKENYLGNLLFWPGWGGNNDIGYHYLYNKGYIKSGPKNTYELYNKKFTLYNLFEEKITVIFTGIFNQQADYGWYPEIRRPVDMARDKKWSPIGENPNQDKNLLRSLDLSYDENPKMSAVSIYAGTDNAMWSQTEIWGIENADDYTSNGGGDSRKWYITYNKDTETYTVKNENCAGSSVILKDQYPTKIEMKGYTTWSGFSQSFKMAILGGKVSWSNLNESPSPGDDGNPAPMVYIIQPGANTIEAK